MQCAGGFGKGETPREWSGLEPVSWFKHPIIAGLSTEPLRRRRHHNREDRPRIEHFSRTRPRFEEKVRLFVSPATRNCDTRGVVRCPVGATALRENHTNARHCARPGSADESDRHFGARRFIAAFVSSPSIGGEMGCPDSRSEVAPEYDVRELPAETEPLNHPRKRR
jgi:hypothetical protein